MVPHLSSGATIRLTLVAELSHQLTNNLMFPRWFVSQNLCKLFGGGWSFKKVLGQ